MRIRRSVLGVVSAAVLSVGGFAAEGLIAHWRFEEGEGDVAFTSVGRADALVKNGTWTGGVVGSALAFYGEKSYLDCGPVVAWLPNQQLTIAFWVRLTQAQASGAIVAVANGVGALPKDYGLVIHARDTDTVRVVISDGDRTQTLVSSAVLADLAWHHVVFVMDTDSFALYVDGSIVGQKRARTLTPRWGDGFRFFVGDLRPLHGVTTWRLLGMVDELRVYNRALSAKEVGGLYVEEGKGVALRQALVFGGIGCVVGFLP